MEVAVSEFVSHTGSEPGLARDILQTANWDLHRAYNIYNDLRSSSSSTQYTVGKKTMESMHMALGISLCACAAHSFACSALLAARALGDSMD